MNAELRELSGFSPREFLAAARYAESTSIAEAEPDVETMGSFVETPRKNAEEPATNAEKPGKFSTFTASTGTP
ncbi:MAG TPA: hypothetical protein VH988_13250 [Thermoanaerobaculia bacterium]|jgi:hypothetical protein|nr:hypothetical protein [Thermoanaerobaculia bacterium]